MGTAAIKKDRRDKASKGTALRGPKVTAKAAKPTKQKSKKSPPPVKAVKSSEKVKKKEVKEVPSAKKMKSAAKLPEKKESPKQDLAKKQAAPKKAQMGKATMTQVESTMHEGTAVRSINKAKESGKSKEGHCPNCSVFSNCRRRDFSEQAMTVLLLWGEIAPAAVEQPVCDDCYEELREVLIDRADEVDAALSGKGAERIREMMSRAAS